MLNRAPVRFLIICHPSNPERCKDSRMASIFCEAADGREHLRLDIWFSTGFILFLFIEKSKDYHQQNEKHEKMVVKQK